MTKLLNSAPVLILGVILALLFVRDLPPQNHDIAVAIVSGLLGFLARATLPKEPPSGS